jgi:hypothetical protein
VKDGLSRLTVTLLGGFELTFGSGSLSFAKTSSVRKVIDLSAPSGHNRGS